MATSDYTVSLTQDVNTISLTPEINTATFSAEGPQGVSGGFYAHSQGSPSQTWTIDHNLGYNPGGITVVDSAGSIVEGAYEYTSVNQLIATFSGAFSGTAYLS